MAHTDRTVVKPVMRVVNAYTPVKSGTLMRKFAVIQQMKNVIADLPSVKIGMIRSGVVEGTGIMVFAVGCNSTIPMVIAVAKTRNGL